MWNRKKLGIVLILLAGAMCLQAQPDQNPELIFFCYSKNGKKLQFETHEKTKGEVFIKAKNGSYKMAVTYFSKEGEKPNLEGGITTYFAKDENRIALLSDYPNVRLEIKHCRKMMTIEFLNLDHPQLDYRLENLSFQTGQFTVDAKDFIKSGQENLPVQLQLDQ